MQGVHEELLALITMLHRAGCWLAIQRQEIKLLLSNDMEYLPNTLVSTVLNLRSR